MAAHVTGAHLLAARLAAARRLPPPLASRNEQELDGHGPRGVVFAARWRSTGIHVACSWRILAQRGSALSQRWSALQRLRLGMLAG